MTANATHNHASDVHWLNAALIPYESSRWRISGITWPGLTLGFLIYSLITGLGFLLIVDVRPMALCLAMLPMIFSGLVLICLWAGYLWTAVTDTNAEAEPDLSEWPEYLIEGFQLATFYGLLITFLASCTVLLYPIGLIIILAVLACHPLLSVPVLMCRQDKSFLALMDASLESIDLFKQNGFSTWLNTTLYLLIFAGLVYPVLTVFLTLTAIGTLFIPGLTLSLIWGYFETLKNGLPNLEKPEPKLNHPHPAKASGSMILQPAKSPWQTDGSYPRQTYPGYKQD